MGGMETDIHKHTHISRQGRIKLHNILQTRSLHAALRLEGEIEGLGDGLLVEACRMLWLASQKGGGVLVRWVGSGRPGKGGWVAGRVDETLEGFEGGEPGG